MLGNIRGSAGARRAGYRRSATPADRAVASKAHHVIEVPACAALLAPLITVIPLQSSRTTSRAPGLNDVTSPGIAKRRHVE